MQCWTIFRVTWNGEEEEEEEEEERIKQAQGLSREKTVDDRIKKRDFYFLSRWDIWGLKEREHKKQVSIDLYYCGPHRFTYRRNQDVQQ